MYCFFPVLISRSFVWPVSFYGLFFTVIIYHFGVVNTPPFDPREVSWWWWWCYTGVYGKRLLHTIGGTLPLAINDGNANNGIRVDRWTSRLMSFGCVFGFTRLTKVTVTLIESMNWTKLWPIWRRKTTWLRVVRRRRDVAPVRRWRLLEERFCYIFFVAYIEWPFLGRLGYFYTRTVFCSYFSVQIFFLLAFALIVKFDSIFVV